MRGLMAEFTLNMGIGGVARPRAGPSQPDDSPSAAV
jgi:hypothetical protein